MGEDVDLKVLAQRNVWKEHLRKFYSDGEIDQIYFLVLEEITGANKLKILSNVSLNFTPHQKSKFLEILERLYKGEPIQYILGFSDFDGNRFKVNNSVLIPRPETEELVNWVFEDVKNTPDGFNGKILDLGTGSGCIAISLAKRLPLAEIFALDISAAALLVAVENQNNLGTRVKFMEGDILNLNLGENLILWDLIVSNPPYVPKSDEKSIETRVKDFEPAIALFVPEENPLLFYQAILEFGYHNLRLGGKIYFEIHEKLALKINAIGKKTRFWEIEIRKDIYGKDRMICLEKINI